MPIACKPRRICIDLDPDQGFPVAVVVESTRYVEEGGERIADLAPHIDSIAADSPQALAVLGDLAAAATAALLPYQAEVQRLAGLLAQAEAQVTALKQLVPVE